VSSELLHARCDQIGDQLVAHAVGEVDLATASLLPQALRKATAARGATGRGQSELALIDSVDHALTHRRQRQTRQASIGPDLGMRSTITDNR
jgi:hypothetical protein